LDSVIEMLTNADIEIVKCVTLLRQVIDTA